MKNLPVYKHPASYAREHDELAAYRASNQANAACKEAIEAAIRDHYRDNRLDTAAVDQVVQQFGYDRTFHVLAITVCQADWDRRYSPDNRAWANAMSIPANPDTWGTDRNCYLAVNSHPGLVDLFLSQTRKAYAQERQKTSVRDKLKKPPETTSPKISAKSKAPERGAVAKRKRDIQLKFRVTPQEREMIETKMAQFGTTNMAAYLRKMAIDGYVVKLDLPELRELVSLLRYSSNNLNQLTRRAHETGRIYEADLEDIQQNQERIWTAAEKIVSSLAALK